MNLCDSLNICLPAFILIVHYPLLSLCYAHKLQVSLKLFSLTHTHTPSLSLLLSSPSFFQALWYTIYMRPAVRDFYTTGWFHFPPTWSEVTFIYSNFYFYFFIFLFFWFFDFLFYCHQLPLTLSVTINSDLFVILFSLLLIVCSYLFFIVWSSLL